MKRKFFLLPLIAALLLALPLQAQVGKAGKNVVKSVQAATHAAEMATKSAAKVAVAGGRVSLTTQFAKQFPGVVVKAYEFQGYSRPQALRKAVELGANKAKPGWPKLQTAGIIRTQTFKDLTLDGYHGAVPALPHPNHSIYLHRGMGLTEEGLVKLLQKGVLLEEAGTASDWYNTHLAMGGATPGMSKPLLDKLTESKAINFTIDAQEAAHYAGNNSFKDGKLPVVVTTHGMREKKDPLSGYYTFKEDIPTAKFTAVSVLGKGPAGKPVWYRATLAEDGQTLVLTPYQTAK